MEMNKLRLILAIIICATMIGANIMFSSNGNEKFTNISLADIELIATANAEGGGPGSGYHMVWTGHCYICQEQEGLTCDVSSQCCYDQEPYC